MKNTVNLLQIISDITKKLNELEEKHNQLRKEYDDLYKYVSSLDCDIIYD
jgi:hypothetical protein